MHVVHIAYGRINQRLERRKPHALEDPCPEERSIVRTSGAGPDTGEDYNEAAEDVEMAFSVYACGGDEEEACEADGEEVVAC